LQNLHGNLVESNERAETLAEYFEQVQWGNQWEQLPPPENHFLTKATLQLDPGPFSGDELEQVLRKLKRGRASGEDGVLPDFWLSLSENAEAKNVLLHLLNKAWMRKLIPSSWKHATVVTLFKKGNTTLPENYRPISLLSVTYKIFAALLLLRLQSGGVESRLRESSYGFRAGRSTTDAIFIAKRLIETALATKDGKLSILLLDWAKAFDRISQEAMLSALARFGIPQMYIDMIGQIYSERTFKIRDGKELSTKRGQSRGIAQGCPLSPYLFIIMLSVILEDVDVKSQNAAAEVIDTIYADDTLLAASSIPDLQIYLDSVINVAQAYGLKPNWKKT